MAVGKMQAFTRVFNSLEPTVKEVSNIWTAAVGREEQGERLLLDIHSSFPVLARRLQLAYLSSSGT